MLALAAELPYVFAIELPSACIGDSNLELPRIMELPCARVCDEATLCLHCSYLAWKELPYVFFAMKLPCACSVATLLNGATLCQSLRWSSSYLSSYPQQSAAICSGASQPTFLGCCSSCFLCHRCLFQIISTRHQRRTCQRQKSWRSQVQTEK